MVPRPRPPGTLADGLVGPLQIDVGAWGNVLVAQDFIGTLSEVRHDGTVKDLASNGGEVAGVAYGPFGIKFFTQGPGEAGADVPTSLVALLPNGRQKVIADLGAYEASKNPDQVISYGLQGASQDCLDQWPTDQFGPPVYTGQVDSHPYALATTPFGLFVADAAGNDILFVDWFGHIRTVAVLPAVPVTVTQELADLYGLPQCVVGLTNLFEGVPTDVELGPDGSLYVSSLPGGEVPEAGSVLKINPFTGRIRTVGGGLNLATNVAVAPNGTVYAAELGANRVSKVTAAGPVPVADVNEPGGLEWANGRLYATADIFGSGKIVTLAP